MAGYNKSLNDDKMMFLKHLEKNGYFELLVKYEIISRNVYRNFKAREKVAELMNLKVSKSVAVKRVAGMLGVSTKTVYQWIK